MPEQNQTNIADESAKAQEIHPAPPVPESEQQGYRPDAMPVIHDEMAISYDEILDLLKKKAGVIVGKNDPILMMVPFLNAFLQLEIKIVNRHHEALASTMSQKTDSFVRTVKNSVDDLGRTLSSKAIASLEEVFKDHLAAMKEYKDSLKKLSMFVAIGIIFQIGLFFGIAVAFITLLNKT